MASGFSYTLYVANFGPATHGTPSLTTTGAWTQVSTWADVRQGSLAFETGVTHSLWALFQSTAGATLQYRLQDIDNALTIASISRTQAGGGVYSKTTTTFSNLPSGDARIELQYHLSAGTATFHAAAWRVLNTAA
jgi:hypothetical protein